MHHSKALSHNMREIPCELIGSRVRLRPYQPGDGTVLFEAVAESRGHLLPFLGWGPEHASPDASEAYARAARDKWLSREELGLAVFDLCNGRFLGGTGLQSIDWDVPSFEIGYWLPKSATRRRYMTEAVTMVRDMAFRDLQACRVYIRCPAPNTRSIGVAKRGLSA